MGNRKNINSAHAGGPIILALDTTSKLTSIAVARGGNIVGCFGAELDAKRSERLWAELDFLLTECGLTLNGVDLFSVCNGPGAFTGLRIGISAIKGFSTATNRPVVGVTSLEALASGEWPARRVCAMINSYKGEVYSQEFSFDPDGLPIAQSPPVVTTSQEAVGRMADVDDVVFVGDGAVGHADEIREIGGAKFFNGQGDCGSRWVVRQPSGLLANQVARVAFLKYAREDFDKPESLKAFYVRPSEAEVKLSLGVLGSKIKRSSGQK